MVKARPNRQPRNWQDKTHIRSHGAILYAKEKVFNIQEVRPEEQQKKIHATLRKLNRQVERLSLRINGMADCPERAELEAKRLHRQKKINKCIFALDVKQDQANKDFAKRQKFNAKLEVEKIEAARQRELTAKFSKHRDKSKFQGSDKPLEQLDFRIRPDDYVGRQRKDRVNGSLKVVTVKKKVFSQQPRETGKSSSVEKLTLNRITGKKAFRPI